MVFCNKKFQEGDGKNNKVTILILIDGFLQFDRTFQYHGVMQQFLNFLHF